MAKISTTISLQDNVSSVLNKINRNLDKSIESFSGLGAAVEMFESTTAGLSVSSGITRAIGDCNKLNRNLEQARATADRITLGDVIPQRVQNFFKSDLQKSFTDIDLGDFGGEMEKSSSIIDRFRNKFSGASNTVSAGSNAMIQAAKRIALTYASIEGVRALVNITDDLQNSQNRLSVITGNTSNAIKAQQAILNSANDSYSDYGDTVDQVAKLMMNAPNQFKTVGDATKFTNTFQKLGKLGGASVYESSQAMYQLTQSMAKGKLDGDELRSVLEGMPLVANAIAKHFHTDIGTMKQMAAQGKVTADEVKAAMLEAADSTDQQFDKAYAKSKTFGMVWQEIKNAALSALRPVQQALISLWNSRGAKLFAAGIVTAFVTVANILSMVINTIASIGNAIADNWSTIQPILIILGGALLMYAAYQGICLAATVAATAAYVIYMGVVGAITIATHIWAAAQAIVNGTLMACPITWIIMLIVAIIAIIIGLIIAIGKVADSSQNAVGIVVGALNVGKAFIINIFHAVLDIALNVVNVLGRKWTMFANFFGNILRDPCATIIQTLSGMAQQALSILSGIASAIDGIFGSNLSKVVGSWSKNVKNAGNKLSAKFGNGNYRGQEWKDVRADDFFKRSDYSTSYKSGYTAGKNFSNKVVAGLRHFTTLKNGKPDPYKINNQMRGSSGSVANPLNRTAGNTGKTAHNTGKISKQLDTTNQELAYLHDIAHRDVVNKYTTASVNVQMNNKNTINNTNDLDDIIDGLVLKVKEAHGLIAEGV